MASPQPRLNETTQPLYVVEAETPAHGVDELALQRARKILSGAALMYYEVYVEAMAQGVEVQAPGFPADHEDPPFIQWGWPVSTALHHIPYPEA